MGSVVEISNVFSRQRNLPERLHYGDGYDDRIYFGKTLQYGSQGEQRKAVREMAAKPDTNNLFIEMKNYNEIIMKNIKFFIVIFSMFFLNFIEAQITKATSYRFEGQTESPKFSTYNVNILTLNVDNTYKLIFQTYGSKKLARKNIIRETEIEEGIWNIKDSVLTLLSNNNNQELIFSMKNDKGLRVIIDNIKTSAFVWEKIANK